MVDFKELVPALTAFLSVVSLGLVFAAAGRVIPADALPRASAPILEAIPHANAGISLLAIVVISFGWYSIRRHDVARHRYSMATGFGLFALFLALYLYKVVLAGPAPFPGPDVYYTYLYLPVLAVHMVLATVCVPLLFYVLLLALTHPVSELPRTRHPRIGRITVVLWLTSFALGIVVYALLYVVPF